MADQLQITGKIVGGAKQGAFFTQLDWVKEQCLDKLGFAPWPGTLNLNIQMHDVAVIEELKVTRGLELVSPDSNFCSGHVFPVTIQGLPAAVVIPSEDVRVHPKNIVEIISPRMLKESLGLKDGDCVTLAIDRLLKLVK
jgi:CTP-dependent riboflavin kinase